LQGCSIERIVAIAGDRWSLLLVGALLTGPRRTTELLVDLAPICTRTLCERLKRLQQAGIIWRQSYPQAPPRVEYALTERGLALRGVLQAYHEAAAVWGEQCEKPGCELATVTSPPAAPPPARTLDRRTDDVVLL
jgi:DNA-binding HxlR family transcriptional regulator